MPAPARFYARDALGGGSDNDTVRDCVDNIRRFGFCVLDHIIPPTKVAGVHDEVVEATPRIRAAQNLAAPGEMHNQVLFLPKYQQYLSHQLVVSCYLTSTTTTAASGASSSFVPRPIYRCDTNPFGSDQ